MRVNLLFPDLPVILERSSVIKIISGITLGARSIWETYSQKI